MPKTPAKSGKHWTNAENKEFRKLVKHGTPTPLIAWEMDRSTDAIYKHASELGISLKPTNRSPNKRLKKH